MKLAIRFKPIMEKLLKESVLMTFKALKKMPTISQMERELTPIHQLQTQVAIAPQPTVSQEIVGEAIKGENEGLKYKLEEMSASDEGKAKT